MPSCLVFCALCQQMVRADGAGTKRRADSKVATAVLCPHPLLSNPNRQNRTIPQTYHSTSAKAADRLWAEASHAKACLALVTSADLGDSCGNSSSGSSGRRWRSAAAW